MGKSIYDLILTRRSIRQFKPEPVSMDILKKLVDAARVAPSAANRQPLEYIVIENQEIRHKVFPCLNWAGYIAPEGNPKPGKEPMAYVVILANPAISEKTDWDAGAAMENMILAAWEEGIGSCWLVSIDKKALKDILKVPDGYKIDSVLALGYPAEEPIMEDLEDSVKYWKDERGRLHVPKRKLDTIIHFDSF